MSDLMKVLIALRPGVDFSNPDNTLANIRWDTPGVVPPTQAEVDAAMAVIEYQEKRRSEYPPIGDQLDAMYHAGLFPPEMAEKIKAVKDKFPKP